MAVKIAILSSLCSDKLLLQRVLQSSSALVRSVFTFNVDASYTLSVESIIFILTKLKRHSALC